MESTVRLVTWNILHGGGPKRTPAIGLALHELAADLVVLTEFRTARGGQIRAQLADAGLEHQAVAPGREGGNGMLMACRERLEAVDQPGDMGGVGGRWLRARVPAWGLEVLGVHVPDDGNPGRKAGFWRRVIGVGRGSAGCRLIVLGDFNTGRRGQDGDEFGCEALLGTFVTLGFVDAWRVVNPQGRENSWEGPQGQGRIDTAYLSPLLRDALVDARYEHRLRLDRLSDHSPLIVTIRTARNGEAERRAGLFSG
ncbi:hypothetical protein PHYC_03739 [Phycisphaerales bacterium]|nr:hypothetical protein PHYC_03739 [Phycisphaerales bacterium]